MLRITQYYKHKTSFWQLIDGSSNRLLEDSFGESMTRKPIDPGMGLSYHPEK